MEQPDSSGSSHNETVYSFNNQLSCSYGAPISESGYRSLDIEVNGNESSAGISVKDNTNNTDKISIVVDSKNSISVITPYDWQSTGRIVQQANRHSRDDESCKKLLENTGAVLETKMADDKALGEDEIENRLMVILGLRGAGGKLSEAEEERLQAREGTVKLYTEMSAIWLPALGATEHSNFALAMVAVGQDWVSPKVREGVIEALLKHKTAETERHEQEAEEEPAGDYQD